MSLQAVQVGLLKVATRCLFLLHAGRVFMVLLCTHGQFPKRVHLRATSVQISEPV